MNAAVPLAGRLERYASQALPEADRDTVGGAARLRQAMRYALLGGGKRIRALLVYAAGEATGATPEALDPLAAAVECVHAYSLVHDDLPCMDDDVLRRGRPTAHVAFDEATALLAGDALQAEAFHLVAQAPLPAPVVVRILRELALASGVEGMCGGQAIDLAAEGCRLDVPTLEAMHRRKTGALLHASVLMGALAGGAPDPVLAALGRYAAAIGLAFQIVDDILDAEEDAQQLGKTPGKDAAQGKATYVTLLGVESARQRAAQCHGDALAALADSGLPPGRTLALREIADRILARRS